MNGDRFLCLEIVPIRSGAAILLALAVIVRFADPAIAQQDNVREGPKDLGRNGPVPGVSRLGGKR